MKYALITVRKIKNIKNFFPYAVLIEGENLKEKILKGFKYYNAIIFIGSIGIITRYLKLMSKSKLFDPAIVVLDEKLRYCIPLLSSHFGGALDLSLRIEKEIKSISVITTATDTQNLIGIDLFARRNNLIVDKKENIKLINSKLLNEKKISVNLPNYFELPKYYITSEKADVCYESGGKILNLIPKDLVLGIGFHKNENADYIYKKYLELIDVKFRNRIQILVSHEKKWNTKVFHEFSRKINVTHTKGYNNFELQKAIDKLNIDKENIVKKHMGISEICRPACFLASNNMEELITIKDKNIKFSIFRIQKYWKNPYLEEDIPEVIK
ncbi:cobalamin biosynthesis protein CbiG [Tepiditoga spiralis]|uniref:Cobalamin biosynthesis protein CbiG n=1 Tax=Tepiditoga spiralis TaxID=2108365 RepID=A0A7G1G4Y9_9BACT|nr:cobalamin biosynthesis protein [Tepiditoga spiralis]BBE31618.1 cobalamin biosynthesis protein CbiG [Tepiditoga spiralis]